MEVQFLRSFLSDMKNINDKKLKAKVKMSILELETSSSLENISGIKKMKGHPSAYRIRIGDYRLGFYKDNNKIELARFVKRNDIYKLFP